MISSTSWGTKWYITLFVNTLPFSQQLRLWDALWLDGRDVMVMVTVAILWAFRGKSPHPSSRDQCMTIVAVEDLPSDGCWQLVK